MKNLALIFFRPVVLVACFLLPLFAAPAFAADNMNDVINSVHAAAGRVIQGSASPAVDNGAKREIVLTVAIPMNVAAAGGDAYVKAVASLQAKARELAQSRRGVVLLFMGNASEKKAAGRSFAASGLHYYDGADPENSSKVAEIVTDFSKASPRGFEIIELLAWKETK